MSTNDGGPAFPCEGGDGSGLCADPGMSLRQYAAIHLRVPNSGTDWLDEMIREAQRADFAGKALITLAPQEVPWSSTAKYALVAADAMLAAINKTP